MAKHGNDLAWRRCKVLQNCLRQNGSINRKLGNDGEVVRIIWNKHPFLSPTLHQFEVPIWDVGVSDPEKIWKVWVKWGHLPQKSKWGWFFNHSRKMVPSRKLWISKRKESLLKKEFISNGFVIVSNWVREHKSKQSKHLQDTFPQQHFHL